MRRIRDLVLVVHRWTGLTIGLVLVFLAITGTSMVFRPQIEPYMDAQHADATCNAPLPLDDLVAGARQAVANGKVAEIELYERGREPTIVRFSDMNGIYLDPCTGRVLGRRDRWGGFFGTVEWLHRMRFVGNTDISEPIGATVAIAAALVMVAGGLVVWWPRSWKAFRNAIKFRLGARGRAFDLGLHHTLGFYVAAVLLLSSMTSLTFTFGLARQAIFAATRSQPLPRKPQVKPPQETLARYEVLLDRVRQATPDARDILVKLPRKPGDAVEADVLEHGAPHSLARTFVYLAPSTGEILRVDSYATSGPGNKIYRFLGAVHTGEVGGLPLQLILFTGILGVPVLAFTGIRSYFRARASLNAR